MGVSSGAGGLPQKQLPGENQAPWVKPLLYGALNIASASGIVFANKAVFSTYGFKFTCALTWIHTLCTLVGMRIFLRLGIFQYKKLPQLQLLPLAVAYVGYIVLCNLSLNVNTVGFYQVMKVGKCCSWCTGWTHPIVVQQANVIVRWLRTFCRA